MFLKDILNDKHVLVVNHYLRFGIEKFFINLKKEKSLAIKLNKKARLLHYFFNNNLKMQLFGTTF